MFQKRAEQQKKPRAKRGFFVLPEKLRLRSEAVKSGL